MHFRGTAGRGLSILALRCSLATQKLSNALYRRHLQHTEQSTEYLPTTPIGELDINPGSSDLQATINDILNDSITAEEMENALTQGFQQLLQTGTFSDLAIVCGDIEFKVHKVVLYSQSDYFKKLLASGFKEATQNSIRLEEDDPDALNVLINFLYRYNAAISTPATKTPQTFAVAVYAIADKYAVPALRATAASHLGMILSPAADLEDFLSALRAVDNQVYPGDKALWAIVIKAVRRHMRALVKEEAFLEVVREVPVLMVELLKLAGSDCGAGMAFGGSGVDYGDGGRSLG